MRYIAFLIMILGIILALLFTGCISGQTPRAPAEKDSPSYAPSSESYQNKALQLEEAGEIQRALYYWRIAGGLEPMNKGISEKIDQLEAITRWISKRHFRRGLAFYEKNQKSMARREFLVVLRYDPYHEGALFYIKEKLAPLQFFPYIVTQKDSFRTIAEKVYKDPDKSFLIALLAEKANRNRPISGQVLLLPILDDRFITPVVDLERELNFAKKRVSEKDYDEAIKILKPLFALEPENKNTRALMNRAYYEWGIRLNGNDRPVEALKKLEKVDPTYRDVMIKIRSTQAILKKQGEEHYRRGLKYFVDDDIERAIEEWERTLYLDPGHKKAKKNILDAKKILKQLKEIE